jgi:hypothetical protein
MNDELLLSDKGFRWISTIYYQVADSLGKVNSFKHLTDFLEAKVGDLGWGTDESSRNFSKSTFCKSFAQILDIRGYHISTDTIKEWFLDDSLSNYKMVERLNAMVND